MKLSKHNVKGKLYRGDWVYPPRTDRSSWLAACPFVVFLVIYLITVISNVSMILLIRTDSKLQTPMYFFLSHLSFVDLCYATTVTPQMLVHFLCKRKTISFLGCFIQFHFFIALVIADYYMLTVMAYDHYVAIGKPLLYGSKMSRGVCFSLVAAPYSYGFANGLAQTILMLRLSFCGPNEINHFYCADPPLLVLACSDTNFNEPATFMGAGFNLMCSLIIIFISYIFMSPMINPLIYSLRNKDVKKAIRRVIQDKFFVK